MRGNSPAATLLTVCWLGVVAYTWVAPSLFERMLKKELASVQLKPDF